MTSARLLGHYRGLSWADVRALPLRDFNALVSQMDRDQKRQQREGGSPASRRPRLT